MAYSIEGAVLAYLQRYRHISTGEIISQFNVMRPAVIIHRLKAKGHVIETERVKTHRKDNGAATSYARYWYVSGPRPV